MENVRRKNNMIETYCVSGIDIACAILSYALSLFIRFRVIHYELYPKQFHMTVGAYIVVLCLVYALFLDANRNFFTRGYYQEFYYTVRYTLIIIVGLVMVLYITQQSYSFSRLIYFIFAILNTMITYCAHLAFKKLMWGYYKKSISSTKMLVLAREGNVDEVVANLIKNSDWYYQITSAAVYDADKKGQVVNGIPVVASRCCRADDGG